MFTAYLGMHKCPFQALIMASRTVTVTVQLTKTVTLNKEPSKRRQQGGAARGSCRVEVQSGANCRIVTVVADTSATSR